MSRVVVRDEFALSTTNPWFRAVFHQFPWGEILLKMFRLSASISRFKTCTGKGHNYYPYWKSQQCTAIEVCASSGMSERGRGRYEAYISQGGHRQGLYIWRSSCGGGNVYRRASGHVGWHPPQRRRAVNVSMFEPKSFRA